MPRSKTTTSSAPPVRVSARNSFVADVRAQVRWLRGQDEPERVVGLREGVQEARELLSQLPRAGALIDRDGDGELRKLVLRKVPFVVWYVFDERSAEVWMVRLFHVRQRRSQTSAADPADSNQNEK
jgi:plasmid stabilization system protein ParE